MARLDRLAEQLAQLQLADPAAAVTLAIELVAREHAHRVLEPALDLLAEAAPASARPALRSRFVDLTSNGMRIDQDCALRLRLVRAFRAIGSHEDADLAELGLRTIQLQPPGRIDVAQPLRGQCLLWLSELDAVRAPYFAVELLHDPHLSRFSGEPAVTAIQVLASAGQVMPVWALARRPGPQPDVLAQAFASLRTAPADLQLDALLEHLAAAKEQGEDGEGVALVVAEAIVLNGLAAGYPAVIELLITTPNQNLFLYLALTAARAPDAALRAHLVSARKRLTDLQKQDVLTDALARTQK